MKNIHRQMYCGILKQWRERRHQWFVKKLMPSDGDAVLDVGGFPYDWTRFPATGARLVTLNLQPVNFDAAKYPEYRCETRIGDGCALTDVTDGEFDIGYSNSVIEHVGDWNRQKAFASELRRVADGLWVQTPAYESPVEPHYLGIFFQRISPKVQKKLVRWVTLRGWLAGKNQQEWKTIYGMIDGTRLLRKREMQELFPDCIILTERLFRIFPKSYIAMRPRRRK